MITPSIILKKTFAPEEINIIKKSETNRSIDKNLEQKAKMAWKEILKESNENLWDGTCYRLDNIEEVKNGSLNFEISTIKYSLVIGYKEISKENKLATEQYSNHISTGGLIKTSDDIYIFGNKNEDLKNPQISLIGGGLQEDELEVNSGMDIQRNLFKEIKEEINLSEQDVLRSKIIGILMSGSSGIIIVFETILKISSQLVLEKFKKRCDEEIKSLVFIPQNRLKDFIAEQKDYGSLISDLL